MRFRPSCLNPCSSGSGALTGRRAGTSSVRLKVLILVLVEVALWLYRFYTLSSCYKKVLILVLVEVALWLIGWSVSIPGADVLILVLVEVALWQMTTMTKTQARNVLILVLVEVALWPCTAGDGYHQGKGLNPCSSGSGALTCFSPQHLRLFEAVLILVLVEVALWLCCWRWQGATGPMS